ERRRPALAAEVEAGCGRSDRADVELALAADVEEAHAERSRSSEARERQRRRCDERLAERARGDERRVDQLAVARQRVVPGRLQHDSRREEREEERRRRHGDDEPARLLEPPFNAYADRALPP